MKKYISIILLAIGIILAGCREDFTELNKEAKALCLTANADTLVLDQTEYDSDGLILTWTSGTNQGTGHRIYYSLEVAVSGQGWENAQLVMNGEAQKYEYKWTVDGINDLVVNTFGLPIDQPAMLTARISASGDGFETQVSECTVVIMPYKPLTHTLYMVGNATPGGWTLADATSMEMKEIGYFKTTVLLKKGFFKFITTQEGMLPGYMPGATNEDIELRESSAQQDKMWTITEDHLYEVTANLITMKMSLRQVTAVRPDYEDLYLIGNETGWSFWPMTRDPLDPFLFRIGHYWTQGKDFKFGTASGAWENNYKATSENAPFTQESMAFVKGYDPDNKWWLQDSECNKMYKICVDIHTAQERMIMREYTPYEAMYMVGDATSGGWSLDDATAMTQVDDSLFTWTGKLQQGALKFSCDKQGDWMGAWFMAYEADKVPTGEVEPVLFIDKHDDSITRYHYAQSENINVNDVDQKWSITEAGTYTITLDQLHETIIIEKQ